MYLHLCPECDKGNHARCWRTQPSHPPGSYGGSKCRCGCEGNSDYDKPKSAFDEEFSKLFSKIVMFRRPAMKEK